MFIALSSAPIFAQSAGSATCKTPDATCKINPVFPTPVPLVVSPDNKNGQTLTPGTTGVPVQSGPDSLPDMPEAKVRSDSEATSSSAGFSYGRKSVNPPPMGAGADGTSRLPYLIATGSVFASNIAAIELMQGCLAAGGCRSLPTTIRPRFVMYGVGLEASAGVSYLGYYLKKKEKRWWFVPQVLATSFDFVFIVKAGKRPH
jgi:hypothetical protein